MPYCGKDFWTRQIPTSCLQTWLVFIHIEHICSFFKKSIPKCQNKWNNVYNEEFHYMFNVYKNQQSRQTGSKNLMGPKTLPTIWGTYMKHVTKYQISAINSCWKKCDEKCVFPNPRMISVKAIYNNKFLETKMHMSGE
jgi:hypothetical protein